MARRQTIGSWRKQPGETLRYEVLWTEFLLPDEKLLTADLTVLNNTDLSPLEISGPYLLESELGCVFFIKGGLSGAEYQVTHRVTTTAGQTVEREIAYRVEEA